MEGASVPREHSPPMPVMTIFFRDIPWYQPLASTSARTLSMSLHTTGTPSDGSELQPGGVSPATGASAQEVANLEATLGFPLPVVYREYLLWMGRDYFGIGPVRLGIAAAPFADLAVSGVTAPALVVGAPLLVEHQLYNCAVVIHRGRVLGVAPKSFLPTYREFYEARWFASGADQASGLIAVNGSGVRPTAVVGWLACRGDASAVSVNRAIALFYSTASTTP